MERSKWPSVLVVDDDAMNIEVIKTMLVTLGVQCDTKMSGVEALQ